MAATTAPHLFLGHSHKDKPFVRRLAKDLDRLSVDVWIDQWELEPGDSLHAGIGAALRTSAYMGLVLSPDSARSRWCKAELEQSLAREMRTRKKVIVPLLCRKVRVPPFLEDRLYIDFRHSYLSALAQLAGFVHRLKQRDLSEQIDASPPRSLRAVERLLKNAGWSPAKELSSKDYETIRRILERAGVRLSTDEFEIIPRLRNPRARPKKALLK